MSVRRFKRKTPKGTVTSGWVVDVCHTNLDGITERYRRHPHRHTRSDALALEQKLISWLEDRDSKLRASRTPTFADFSVEFMQNYASVHNKPSELHSKNLILKNYLLPYFGDLKLAAVGNREIDRYKAERLKQPLAPKTINNHLAVLRRMLTLAEEYGLIGHRPIVKALRATSKQPVFLTEDQATALLAATVWPWRGMVLIALQAGLRLGEMLALRWQEVHLDSKKLVICRNDWRGIVSTPKGHKPREVPMSQAVHALLKEHALSEKSEPKGLVFCRPRGGALTYQQCRRPLLNACKRAQIIPVLWHALRHTFASHLVIRGASLKAVQELLGHTTQAMTERYAHFTPQARREAVSLFDRTVSSSR